MKNLLSFLFCLLFVGSVYAVSPMTFESNTYDIGTVSEDDSPVKAPFVFTNTGSEPLVVTHIRTSCGCIATDFTKTPVEAGKKGYINLSFNPDRQPGLLKRAIFVYTNLDSSSPTAIINLEGRVTPTTKAYADFQYTMGDLKLRQTSVNFDTFKASQQRVERIHVANSGKKMLTLKFKNVPPFMECSVAPERLTPGDRGDIIFTIKPGKAVPGEYSGEIYLEGVGDDKLLQMKRTIRYKAVIE